MENGKNSTYEDNLSHQSINEFNLTASSIRPFPLTVHSLSKRMSNEQIKDYLTRTCTKKSKNLSLSDEMIDTSLPLSKIEDELKHIEKIIESNENEEIVVNGQRGIWLNKHEALNWKGSIPLSQYPINNDQNPEIITKRPDKSIRYVQELAIRYLKPPTPEPSGDIIIKQLDDIHTPPAPPLILRQQPPRPPTPEPIVIRETPPIPPPRVGRKVVTISGQNLPPPPRKVVIERLPPLPPKPQSVIIERWLPYRQPKRKVVLVKPNENKTLKPKNVIVQWSAPEIKIKQEVKHLGVIKADPSDYIQRFGSDLCCSNELPKFVRTIPPPQGLQLASDAKTNDHPELEGDLHALNYIDLNQEGLSHYKHLIANNENHVPSSDSRTFSNQITASSNQGGKNLTCSSYHNHNSTNNLADQASPINIHNAASICNNKLRQISIMSSSSLLSNITNITKIQSHNNTKDNISEDNMKPSVVSQIFNILNEKNQDRITYEDVLHLLVKLNETLGRNYTEEDAREFYSLLELVEANC